MGIFTWTDACVKNPKCDKYGDYKRKDIVEYGGYAKLICPDNTEIETSCHDYYGIIGGHDIYDLVAEWNREELSEELLREPTPLNKFGGLWDFEKEELKKEGKSDEEINELDKAEQKKYYDAAMFRRQKLVNSMLDYKNGMSDDEMEEKYGAEWKREIGIAIAAEDDSARKLKYPIKLTRNKDAHGYDSLYISYSCQ